MIEYMIITMKIVINEFILKYKSFKGSLKQSVVL